MGRVAWHARGFCGLRKSTDQKPLRATMLHYLNKKGLTRVLRVQGGVPRYSLDSGRARVRVADSAAIPAVTGGGLQVDSGG